MGERPGIVLYFEMRKVLKRLNHDDGIQLILAMLDYGETGKQPDFNGNTTLEVVWDLIEGKLDRDKEKYEETLPKRRYAAYCREQKKIDAEPMSFDDWEREIDHMTSCDTKRYLTKTKSKSKTLSPPTSSSSSQSPTPPESDPLAGFDRFWEAYPKKLKLGEAKIEWMNIAPDPDTVDAIINAVEAQKARNKEWKKENGRYIPLPVNWLKDKRWKEEIPKDPYEEAREHADDYFLTVT